MSLSSACWAPEEVTLGKYPSPSHMEPLPHGPCVCLPHTLWLNWDSFPAPPSAGSSCFPSGWGRERKGKSQPPDLEIVLHILTEYSPALCVCVFFVFLSFFFFFFWLFRVSPMTHGNSQARGPIRTTAAPHTTATATPDPSHICNLHRSSWQHQILNPLRAGIELASSWILVGSFIC